MASIEEVIKMLKTNNNDPEIKELVRGLEEVDFYEQNMNGTVDAEKRNITLNESVRLRTADYNIMLYYFVGMMVMLSLILLLKNWLTIVPSFVYETLIIVVVVVFLYFIYKKYVDISNRDSINYNEVSMPVPNNVGLDSQQIADRTKQNLNSMAGGGSLLDMQARKCDADIAVTPSPSGTFTSTSTSTTAGPFTTTARPFTSTTSGPFTTTSASAGALTVVTNADGTTSVTGNLGLFGNTLETTRTSTPGTTLTSTPGTTSTSTPGTTPTGTPGTTRTSTPGAR
jgi:hypothetical protein